MHQAKRNPQGDPHRPYGQMEAPLGAGVAPGLSRPGSPESLGCVLEVQPVDLLDHGFRHALAREIPARYAG